LAGDVGDVRVTAKINASLKAYRWTARAASDALGAAVGALAKDDALLRRLAAFTDTEDTKAAESMLREIETSAVGALLQPLAESKDGKSADIPRPEEYSAPGSGYFFARCQIGDTLELGVLLWPGTVRRWLEKDAPKPARMPGNTVSRSSALDTQTVSVEIVAGEAELVLEELRGLSEGVVIKLDRRLDQPLSVRLVGDGVVCAGHLGSNGSRRAVQVIAKN
jgi:flagellar motor switch/type III secretory pathway protein FliN